MTDAADITITTDSAAATRALGGRLGQILMAGDLLLLHGDLGAGKTALAQGIIAARRPGMTAQSPTFTLINPYPSTEADPVPLYHLDLYRLDGPDDLDSIGFDDLVADAGAIILVEWPERLGADLPADYLLVSLTERDPESRSIHLRAVPADGRHARLIRTLAADRT